MAGLVIVTADPAQASPRLAGRRSKALTTFRERLLAVGRVAAAGGGLDAPADRAVTYPSCRSALAVELSKFGLLPKGSEKVAGDVLGVAVHGIAVVRVVGGKKLVFVAETARVVEKALGVLNSLPPKTSEKAALAAVRAALGLDGNGEQVVAASAGQESVNSASGSVAEVTESSVGASAGDAPGQGVLFDASVPSKPAHAV